MNLQKYYNDIHNSSIKTIESNNFNVDTLLNSVSDNRYGITLLVRPPEEIKNQFQLFMNQLREIDPTQYYYRNSDIHVTLLSIISCYDGFSIKDINIEAYKNIIEDSINKSSEFNISFNGVVATKSAILIKGFLSTNILNEIRDRLRINFINSGLEQSIDQRYSIQTAHSTVVRFRSKAKNLTKYLDVIEKFKNHNFGSFKVNKLELVGNDWYQKIEKVRSISSFYINDRTK